MKYTEIEIYSIENAIRRYNNAAKFLQINEEKCKTLKDMFDIVTENITSKVVEYHLHVPNYKWITFDDEELRFTIYQEKGSKPVLDAQFEVYNMDTTEYVDYFDTVKDAKVAVDKFYAEQEVLNPYEPDPYDEYMDRKLEEKEWN